MIHTDLPFSQYKQIEAVNSSTAKIIHSDCPQRYLHSLNNPRPDTPALAVGRLFHTAILEPNNIDRDVACLCDDTKSRLLGLAQNYGSKAKEFSKRLSTYKEWLEDQGDREIVSEEDLANATAARAVIAKTDVGKLIDESDIEVSIENVYEAEAGDVKIKGRLDCWHRESKTIIDLKTCADASPRVFGQATWNFNYLFSAGFYRLLTEFEGERAEKYYLLAVEKTAPYMHCLFEVPPAHLRWGEEMACSALERIAQCQADDNWPGYPNQTLMLPGWAEKLIQEDTETFPDLPDPF